MRAPTIKEQAGIHCVALLAKENPWVRPVIKRLYQIKNISGRLDFNIGLLTNIAKGVNPAIEHVDNIELVANLEKLGLLKSTTWGDYKTPVDVLTILEGKGVIE